jgi:hypothetical protein
MNKDTVDSISKIILAASEVLFLKNSRRTALGALLGCIIQIVLSKILIPLNFISIDIIDITWHEYIILGIGILYLPLIIKYMFTPAGLGEEIELAIKMIKKAEKSGVPKSVIKDLYNELTQMVLKNSILKKDTQQEINDQNNEKK